MRLGLCAALCVIIVASLATARAQDTKSDAKLAIPAKVEQDKAEKIIKDLFKAEYAKLKAPDRAALAQKLSDQADDTKDDPVARYVLLREARDVAAKAGDSATAIKAANELGNLYQITVHEATVPAAEMLVPATLGAEKNKDLAVLLVEAADNALSAGDFDSASKLLKSTDLAARKANVDVGVAKRNKSLALFRKDFEKLNDANETLKKMPEDAAANALVGKFNCLVKGDWAAGIPLLVKGSDATLKSAAEADIQAAAGASAEQEKAGDSWYKVASGEIDPAYKLPVQQRSVHWYREAIGGLTGLSKLRVEKRIEELAKVAGSGVDPKNKWNLIKSALKNKTTKDWNTVGGAFHQQTFREVPTDGAILIGFRYTTQQAGQFPGFLQGIYLTPKGELPGIPFGVALTKTNPLLVTKAKSI